jgi:translocation and assembly module TamB
LAGTARVPDLAPLQALWPAWPFASGSLKADLSLRGSWRDPDGQLRVIGRDLRPSEDSAVPPGPYAASGEAGFRDGRLAIHHLELKTAAGRLDVRGEMTGIPPLPQLVAVDSPPNRVQVSLNGKLTIADLGWLARRIGGVRRASGRLEARMAVNGPLHEPAMEADVRLSDGALRPEADIPPFQALNLEARLSGRTLEIDSFRGEMGGAPFVLSGRIENVFTPLDNGRADLRLDGKNLLFYRSDAIRLRADANLTVSGPIPRMTLAGGIVVTDGFFGKNLGLLEGLEAGSSRTIAGKGIELFSITAAPFSDTVFDVDITAAAPFEIKNNLARAAVRPDLHLNGTGRAPALTGKIYFEPSTLFLPAGRMQLQSGLVRFDASDPGRPNLALVATARMLGYDVTAVAEGPYDEPTVTLSSVPPIPDSELLMLVLTGQAPKTTGARASEGGRSLNVAVFFGRDMITRIEGDDSTETLQSILERFDVEVGRFVTRAGDETINAEFRLADDVVRRGDTLYLTAEKDIYDYYNAGIKIVFRFR